MSCLEHTTLDWPALVAYRRDTGEDPAGWDEAMERLETCDACRRQALIADPTLVFRRMPRVETDAAEVESMRQAVASLRRASRVATVDREGTAEVAETNGTGRFSRGLRQAAAAVLLTAAGLAAWVAAPHLLAPTAPAGEVATPASQEMVAEGVAEPATALDAASLEVAGLDAATLTATDLADWVPGRVAPPSAEELAARPVFEGLSQPQTADVYQVGEEDLLVVMVVDETLDI